MEGLVRRLILTMTPMLLLTDSVPSEQFAFKRVDLSGAVQTTALEQSTRRSRLDCAQGCASNAECFSFGFLSGSRLCRQFPVLVSRVHVNQTEENPVEEYYWKLAGCPLGLGYVLTSDGSTCLGVRRQPERTFLNASLACQQEGAHLLVLRDKQHMDVVLDHLNQTGVMGAYLVGLTDLGHDGNYRWLDGTAIDPSLWKPGHPNNFPNQDCGVLSFRDDNSSPEKGLNDLDCDVERKYICQIPTS